MPTPIDLPDDAHAAAEPAPVEVHAGKRRGARPAPTATIDGWRVGVLALVTTGHIVGLGLMALPDTPVTPAKPIRERMADAPDSDRLTLFVDLESASAPPQLPSMPPSVRLAVPPTLEPVPATPAPTRVAAVAAAPTPDFIPITTPQLAATPTPAAPAATPLNAASAAPSRSRGDPAQVRNDRDAYMRALMAALLQHRSYPPEARKQRARGTVHVRFSVDRDGHVLASGIARGAGFEILETAALEVLRSADPLPPIPESLGVDRLTVTVPIEYSLITR